MAGVPWYRSISAITALVVMSEAGLLGVLVLVPRLFEVDALSSAARLLLVIVPIVYALAVGASYSYWLVWRLRDVRLWRFAVLNDHYFFDVIETGPGVRPSALAGTGFPKNMRIVMRAVFGRHDERFGEIMVGRSRAMRSETANRVNLRRPFAFARMNLPAKSPHVIVRNRRSPILSLAGLSMGTQVDLLPEGDPDHGFTVLCPQGFEQEARRLFTSEVLRTLWISARSCEFELIDDELYVYFAHSTPLWKPEAMEQLQTTLALLRRRVVEHIPRRFDSEQALKLGAAPMHGTWGSPGSPPHRVDLSGRRIINKDGVSAMTWVLLLGVLLFNALVTVFVRFVLPILLQG